MEDRIFWVLRSNEKLGTVGYPLTLEQLKSEFKGTGFFDVDRFLSGETKKPYSSKGRFSERDEFFVWEVNSLTQLKNLMLWRGFHPESTCAYDRPIKYPDFVHEDFRLPDLHFHNFSGYTDNKLPVSGKDNPTAKKYNFGYAWESMCFLPMPTHGDILKNKIADLLVDGGSITPTDYNNILCEYGLTDYLVDDKGMDER